MKEHKERNTNPKSKSISLPALLAAVALGISATGAYAQIIVTPDQFINTTWPGSTLQQSTVGAYSGDNASGYYNTPNYGAAPSGLINVPLSGLAPGWNLYNIYEWNPVVTSVYHVLNVINNGIGYGVSVVPGEPWAGQFGTQQQYLQVNGAPAGQWVELGPGPQADPSLGNQEVWINGSGAPSFLQFHYGGSYQDNQPFTFDAIKVVQVPEPSTLALGLLGGFGLLTGLRRAKH
jgi:hypothetical protein